MADVHHLVTLGIGSPADIAHFILVGLSPTGVIVVLPGVIALVGSYQPTVQVTGSYQPTIDIVGSMQGGD